MKNKKAITLILITLILLTVGIGFALEGLEEMEYAEYLKNVVFEFTNPSSFNQPKPSFLVETSTNEKIQAGPSDELEADMYYKNQDVEDLPIAGTFPVGTSFKGISNSAVGSGTKIDKYDWQLRQYDKDFKRIKTDLTTNSKSSTSNTITADKEGYIVMFLNVADNYVAKHKVSGKPINFENWASSGNWLNKSKGSVANGVLLNGWYFQAIKFKIGSESEMILKEMELLDPETGEVLESFKRDIDPVNPFNKQKVNRTSTSVTEASILEREKEYEIRAKYQYVDFSKGKFDITKPETMTEKQKVLSTEVYKNTLDVKYAYDENALEQGKFDISAISTSKDKPTIALKNLEEANFSWKYKAPKDEKAVKAVKIAGFIPKDFPKIKNISNKDDWGTLYARFEKGEDLEVSRLTGGSGRAGETVKVYVTVKNNGEEKHITDVTLTFPSGTGDPQVKPVTLEAEEVKVLEFDVKIPESIAVRYPFMATINKSRVIEEITYDNNSIVNRIEILKDPFIPDLDCPSEEVWTEYVDAGEIVYVFEYKATLESELEILDDRELMSDPKKIKLKSGYGFKTNVESRIRTEQISGAWKRPHKRVVRAPDEASVVTSWRVFNINTIGDTTILEREHFSTSVTSGTSSFITPVNPHSKTGASVIYTDLDLKGNTEKSHDHPFKVYTKAELSKYNDGYYGIQDATILCNTLEGEIEIFGNMHEDWGVN